MGNFIELKATARLIKQLGEQLIKDEMVAMIELIKNSYDADATKVDVIIDTKVDTKYGKGKIIIKDNGNGMVPSIIIDSFLKLSTGFKEVEKISPHFKRRVLGKKGIGRLSFQRLGKFIQVYTTPRIDRLKKAQMLTEDDENILREKNKFYVEMDWYNLDFDKDFSEIKAKVEYESDEEPEYGTKIEILGINNIDYWVFNKTKEKELKKSISSIMNPFVENKKSRFKIIINIDGNDVKGDMFDEETLQKSCDSEVIFKFTDWKLSIDIKRTRKYFTTIIDERIKKMKNFNLINNDFKGNEDFYINKYNEHIDVDFMNLQSFKREYTYCKDVLLDTVQNEDGEIIYANPGDFKGKIYAINRTKSSYSSLDSIVESNVLMDYGVSSRADIFSVWDASKGFYIFRNDFRILPYGDRDWNGFAEISQRNINNIFKPHNVSGYIQLDGLTSENLQEQTDRQGFMEDQYGKNFLTIINKVIVNIITRSDNMFNDGFNISKQMYDSKNSQIRCKNGLLCYEKEVQHEEEKRKGFQNLTTEIVSAKKELKVNNIENDNSNISFFDNENARKKEIALKEKIVKIEKIVTEIKDEDEKERRKLKQEKFIAEQKLSQLQDLYPLIAQGIIVETMTHEMNKIEKNIKFYSNEDIKLLQDNNYDIAKLIRNLKLIIDETYFLREQLQHLEPTYTKNHSKKEELDMKEFLEELYKKTGPMQRKAKSSGVDVLIEGDSFSIKSNKGYLITVFDNLFINSLYWIEFGCQNKFVKFLINSRNKSVTVTDSGPGVDLKVEKTLFDPFITMKPLDEGRGLGLYIIKQLLTSMNCGVDLGTKRTNGRLSEFIVNLSGIAKE